MVRTFEIVFRSEEICDQAVECLKYYREVELEKFGNVLRVKGRFRRMNRVLTMLAIKGIIIGSQAEFDATTNDM